MPIMKRIYCIILLLSPLFVVAQTQQVQESSYRFIKKASERANGLSIVLEGTPSSVETVIEQEFKELIGKKPKNIKSGVNGLEAARISTFSTATLDYYYKVEPYHKKEPNKSRVMLFLSAGNYNFLNSDKNPDEMGSAVIWLENLQAKVNHYEWNLAIEKQEKIIKEAQKEQEKLEGEKKKLEKQQAEIAKNLKENETNLENQTKTIQTEVDKLKEMKSRQMKGKR